MKMGWFKKKKEPNFLRWEDFCDKKDCPCYSEIHAMKTFKLWNYTKNFWIEDDINKYIEFDWTLSGHKHPGLVYIKVKFGMDVDIVWQDSDNDLTFSSSN